MKIKPVEKNFNFIFPSIAFLQVLVMPNGEILCQGRSLGFINYTDKSGMTTKDHLYLLEVDK